ncbi:MAG: hypothetical protein QOD99_315 [Chthoniobacter sp.]|nr:hypothetical protein [Chthoniobacter sp.]
MRRSLHKGLAFAPGPSEAPTVPTSSGVPARPEAEISTMRQ